MCMFLFMCMCDCVDITLSQLFEWINVSPRCWNQQQFESFRLSFCIDPRTEFEIRSWKCSFFCEIAKFENFGKCTAIFYWNHQLLLYFLNNKSWELIEQSDKWVNVVYDLRSKNYHPFYHFIAFCNDEHEHHRAAHTESLRMFFVDHSFVFQFNL